jgi:hypothetical protein
MNNFGLSGSGYDWILTLKDELVKLYPKCPICDKKNNSNCEFAHIKKTKLEGEGRGSYNRYIDIANNLDKYRLMHKECHIYYDEVLRDDRI